MLHCGNVQIPGESLIQLRKAVHYVERSLLDISNWGAWSFLAKVLGMDFFADKFLVQEYTDEENKRLIDLLDSAVKLQGSRIHDRVYAIMCLAVDYQGGDITVDYSMSTGQTMACAANHHVMLYQNLRFLNDAGRDDWGDRVHKFDFVHSIPSWIPNTWLGINQVTSLTSSQTRYERMTEDAQAVGDNTYVPDFDDSEELFNYCSRHCVDVEKMRLRVHGVKVDEVHSLLTSSSDDEIISVPHFWSSVLGQLIAPYMIGVSSKIPLQIVRAMAEWWPREEYRYEDALTAFACLFKFGQGAEAANRFIDDDEETGELIRALWDDNHAAGDALAEIISNIDDSTFILTDRRYFGRVRRSAIRAGDEIWMILGCSLPVILRRQSDGTYSHICTARIPVLMDDILGTLNIRNFSPKSVPGDKFGEWTVEYIEII
jgi:hypothetical protein